MYTAFSSVITIIIADKDHFTVCIYILTGECNQTDQHADNHNPIYAQNNMIHTYNNQEDT